ncbi:hypothetical protein HPB50_021905 [Hyalomma asiaticum]|uniref:Uncharacterized protein n=1 Tax=Hyalomma asiaticum TaxID=266040 RepID=A0ACB7T1I1_HYAAI|nr:hypothetical protein HPB50_021905 [Hyalomma asiaticum]
MSRRQTPSEFLKQIIGRPVVVKLNSGLDYRGVLACLDGYMNIALEQTEEYVNGQLKNKYGDAFIRGNNVSNCSAHLVRLVRAGAMLQQIAHNVRVPLSSSKQQSSLTPQALCANLCPLGKQVTYC